MRDQELDAKLRQARAEAADFFSGWSFAPLREKVHRRTSPGARSGRPVQMKAGLILFAAALLLLTVLSPRPPAPPPPAPGQSFLPRELPPSLLQPINGDRHRQVDPAQQTYILVPYQASPGKMVMLLDRLQLKSDHHLFLIKDEDQITSLARGTALEQLLWQECSPQFVATWSGNNIVILQPQSANMNWHPLAIPMKGP